MKHEFETHLTTALLSSPIIYIPHFHYAMLDTALVSILSPEEGCRTVALSFPNDIIEYDGGRKTVINFENKKLNDDLSYYSDATELLKDYVSDKLVGRVLLLKNFAEQLQNEEIQSLLSFFATQYEQGRRDTLQTIIIMSPNSVSAVPLSLRNFFNVIEIFPPNVEEIRNVLEDTLGHNPFVEWREKRIAEDLVRTLQGMQMYEVKQTLRTVLELTNGRLSNKAIREALIEKKKIVKKTGIIEVVDTDVKFDQIGGLQKLRDDLKIKSAIYSNLGDAGKYKVPVPKGILIIGMPGCGKSMIAQATADLFGVSLLRLDVSRLMGKYVGESEANLRLALATAEAAHPCVLWIDEIEKAFAGGNSKSGDNDMLVMRMMGHFLTWMQERKTPVYIVATANDVMRPEFMRKGRFDEVYFVDFPTETERAQILDVKIKKYREMKGSIFDFSEIGDCKDVVKDMTGEYGGFSGSEIECVLNMVVEKKFQKYLEQKNAENDQSFVPRTIKVKRDDFKEAVKQIKDSVMANQKSKEKKEKDYLRDKTSIERIKEMNETYHFVNASKM